MGRFASVILLALLSAAPSSAAANASLKPLDYYFVKFKGEHDVMRDAIKNDPDIPSSQKPVAYKERFEELQGRFKAERSTEYASQRAIVVQDHSCTKGSSGGTKKCGTKCASAPSPEWFTEASMVESLQENNAPNKRKATIKPDGSAACIYLQKSGKGRLFVRVKATFKYRPDFILRAVDADNTAVFKKIVTDI
ncbi:MULTISPECIES: hypothetical protein [Stenotrophomonas]|uniref:hypothetical protein n=1 Tax=Stenotrophomonas TaxID=40323 RepID=UPI001311D52A|nr:MULTISPECIES: hypothetical protein [Stenotrophomonas]ELC7322395.1 hypothetical protein [Stenotrophomonas maltophilia]MBH1662060.1 hypothetical protein [Stenotrophomonas maltophilia]MBH1733669.1 hypothetical protein [Stenotrophomonas maltophilia]MBH1769371.1 hypothetical protein [Stenotrophomonas maltophilia]MDZ5834699.1 hypothetical protein [Stenotrophomonas maltophilia]